MTDRDAMMQAICTDPRADLPRLVFADYLEECGEEDRSSFIRVQVELARSARPCPQGIANAEVGYRHNPHKCFMCSDTGGMIYDCDNQKELLRRERELLKLCWRPYFQHLFPEPHGIEVGTLTMRWGGRIEAEPSRGFISSLTCSWGDWFRHAPALFWHEKQTVECVNCRGTTRDIEAVTGAGAGLCSLCHGTGRIPKPFPPTAQPLEEVRLTSIVGHLTEASNESVETWMRLNRYRFDRETCICGGVGCRRLGGGGCNGEPLNEWYCDEWPGLVFRMPEGGA